MIFHRPRFPSKIAGEFLVPKSYLLAAQKRTRVFRSRANLTRTPSSSPGKSQRIDTKPAITPHHLQKPPAFSEPRRVVVASEIWDLYKQITVAGSPWEDTLAVLPKTLHHIALYNHQKKQCIYIYLCGI